jgi:hypothetical protein
MDYWGAAWIFVGSIDAAKPYVEVVQSALTSIGIVLGAWCVLRKREHFPAASVAHHVERVPLDDGKLLLHVQTTISNVGQRLITLQSA